MKRFTLSLVYLLIILASAVTSGGAAVVYDNGMNHISIGQYSGQFSIDNVPIHNEHIADSFFIQDGSWITDVHWLGFYTSNPYVQQPVPPVTPDQDNFIIRIYANLGEEPYGYPLYEYPVVAVNRVDTGLQAPLPIISTDIYEYSANIDPFPAFNNTLYWIEIYNNINNNFWCWSGSHAFPMGDGVRRNDSDTYWHRTGSEMSFQLTAVPEPSSFLLLGLGLAGVGLFRKRFKN